MTARPRLFVAAWPPETVVAMLTALTSPEEVAVRRVASADLHVTIRFLGAADPDVVVERLRATVLPTAVARLGPAVTRLGRGVLAVPVAGLDRVAEAVQAVTADLGVAPDLRGFRGHLTVARVRDRAASRLLGAAFVAEFPVDELVLADSTVTDQGPQYEVLGRVSLRG